MSTLRVIGVDPGSTVGIFDVRFVDVGTPWAPIRHPRARQAVSSFDVDAELAPLLTSEPRLNETRLLAVERFVVARGSMKGGAHSRRTAERAGDIAAYGERHGWTVVMRNASQVKAWATDARLDAAGLLEACKGMRHARDACRHALFAAVHDGGIPDPLSKEWNR